MLSFSNEAEDEDHATMVGGGNILEDGIVMSMPDSPDSGNKSEAPQVSNLLAKDNLLYL